MPAKFVKSIGRTLDARPDRLDLRDREFTPNVVSLPQQWPDDASIRRLLPRYCKSGLILNQGEDTTFEEDLAKDVLEIITVFSTRLYGSRSRKNQKLLDGVKKAVEESAAC